MKLETERLILRPWEMSDVEDMVEGLNEFEVGKNLTTPYPYSKEDAEYFIKNFAKHDGKRCNFAIVLKSTGKAIGGTEASLTDGKVTGGIWLNKDYHGFGYGSEAFLARIEYAFEILGVNEIENGFFDFNQKSWNMQRKLGYEIVGETKNFSPALGKEVREVVTCLTKENYYKMKKNSFK